MIPKKTPGSLWVRFPYLVFNHRSILAISGIPREPKRCRWWGNQKVWKRKCNWRKCKKGNHRKKLVSISNCQLKLFKGEETNDWKSCWRSWSVQENNVPGNYTQHALSFSLLAKSMTPWLYLLMTSWKLILSTRWPRQRGNSRGVAVHQRASSTLPRSRTRQ